ncbi:MAG: hypothetical protein ACK5NK_00560 [Niabella sp.]
MEFRLDYIEREIKKTTLLLQAILQGLQNPKEPQKEHQQKMMADIQQLLELDNDTLSLTIKKDQRYSMDNLKLLADVFYEIHQQQNNDAVRQKSLMLYHQYMQNNHQTLDLQVYNKIQHLQNQ